MSDVGKRAAELYDEARGWDPLAVVDRAERVARAFHEAYEELAPEFGYETRVASRVPWADVPEQNRRLMVATVERLLARGVIR